ncbi:MAG TPA: DUF3857 domain-containing protein [Candidatus Angelobacter sp.]|nr:DUF3857 domain-containing protein [Candidatus Angelobacter sp.]
MFSFADKKEDWLPITPQDQQVKQVPNSPGADAIQLYYADYINDQEQNEFYYHRIKILNEKGTRHADVEIQIPPGGSIGSLKARTIHPDGAIVEFTGKPFQKTLIKGHGVKILAKTFTMPDVTVGSIIEYKYKVNYGGILTYNYWTIQHELFTVKESFRMERYSGGLQGFEMGYQVAVIYSHMPPNMKPVDKSGVYQMEAENMPAFESEGLMPPESEFTPQVYFFYLGLENPTPDRFWENAGRKWNDDVDHFIGNRKEIREAAAAAIGSETDPEQKLRKLYARAQQVRNLSYERERTEEEQKKENIKQNQNVGDVLSRGIGDHIEITRLMVALARAAGFEATIMRVSNRQTRFFNKGVLSTQQLENEVAVVNVNGKDVYLDPGTRFCPYGLLRWKLTSAAGLKLDKKGGTFVNAPAAPYDKAITRRLANMTMDANGNLKGTIIVSFEGGEALEHRLDGLQTDDAGKAKSLEDELQAGLPTGAIVKMVKADGWESTETPLTVHFDVDMPGYASTVGKRLLVPSYLFQSKQLDAFKQKDRKYPIYFAYAFAEADRVNIQLPPGYTLENAPQPQKAQLGYAGYQSIVQYDGKQLVTQRILQVNGIFFKLDQFGEVKDFFTKVLAGDEQQAVLTGGSTSAQKN